MARGVRVIVLNCDEEYTADLRSKLLRIEGVKIVAEVDEPTLFLSALRQFPGELAVVYLDPNPDELIEIGKKIHDMYPALTLFAISDSNDPNLILNAMRAGFREFLVQPLDEAQLSEAVNRLAKGAPTQPHMGKLICVLGPNGGSGTSTIASNLGCELAQLSQRGTVIADLDFAFGHTAIMLDVSPQFTIADLCQTLESIDPAMVEKALIRHECGAMTLARPQHFAQSEQISAANTANTLNMLCEMFDYVVCDGPPRYDATSAAILDIADVAIMLVNLVVPSVRNADRILHELDRQGYNLERMKIVVNRHSIDSTLLTIDDVEECLGRKVDFVIPDDPKTIISAINMGQPLLTCAPKSRVREAIKALAESIHNPNHAAQTSDPSMRQSIFSKVFK